jgi:hypothetical protein
MEPAAPVIKTVLLFNLIDFIDYKIFKSKFKVKLNQIIYDKINVFKII